MYEDLTITRLGNRIRVSAGAELGPKRTIKDEKMVNTIYRALDRHFPGAANYPAGTQVWHGTRHAIVDGLPAIGQSGIPHLSLNIGHGACGWTWACGSARMLADQISGRPSLLATAPFLPTRFFS
jgi:D-amino-acid dehydrogenase